MTKLTLIIPAYNESESVANTAAKLRPVLIDLRQQYEVEVLFIDDGSRDDTLAKLQAAFADEPGVRVIPHGENKGLGGAIRTGFTNATGDLIVVTDFDGTYAFETIPLMLDQLHREQVDIVTASPYHPQGAVEGVSKYRLMFSYGASLIYRLVVNWKIYCWTAMYRVYRRKVIDSVKFESDDFLSNTEILVKALRAGFKVAEFPTVLHRRQFGTSSMKIARVTLSHLKFQFRLLFRPNSLSLQG